MTSENEKPETRSLTGAFVTFEEPGDCVEGYYQGFSYTTIIQRGDEVSVPKFLVETDEGPKEFLGTTQITENLTRVPAGAYVMISYLETVKTRSGFNVKKFDIQVDRNVKLLPPQRSPEQRQAAFLPNGEQVNDQLPYQVPF